MEYPALYRKRIIPDECVLLKDDQVLLYENGLLITKWNALRPKKDLHHGYSCCFLDDGYKISKFYDREGNLLCHYCDIIDHAYRASDNALVMTDLLADVIVYPDGKVKVVDLDELADVLDSGKLSPAQVGKCLRSLSHLLSLIYAGRLGELTAPIEKFEQQQ